MDQDAIKNPGPDEELHWNNLCDTKHNCNKLDDNHAESKKNRTGKLHFVWEGMEHCRSKSK